MVHKRKSNFTLLEMVLAIAIFAMIMLTIGTGMFSIQQTWRKMSKKSKMIKMYQTLDRVFDTAFRNCVPFSWTNDNFQKNSAFLGNNDECTIAYIHRITNSSNGGIRFLKIYLSDGNLIAAYRQFPILYWNEDDTGIQKEILATEIKAISFLYANREDNEIVWIDDWDEENNQNIPLAIQITVEWKNGVSEQWLRRTAGAGKFESYGKRADSNEK
jgi:type II secretory pathway pseudopilin PulG